MNALQAVLVVSGAGGVGGLTAYLASGGLRKKLALDEGPSETGFVGTIVLGAVAAVLAWAVQSPRESIALTAKLADAQVPNLGDLVAAIGVGLAGAKWLAQSYQAKFYRFVGTQAALKDADTDVAVAIATGERRQAAKAVGAL